MTSNGSLPLPEFDHLPVGSLATRIRSLDVQQVEQLIEYERNHAQRVQVLGLLERRRDELKDGHGPTGGDPNAVKPELAGQPAADSKAGPEPGPPINPPSQGAPDNPSQPR
jgi:hypothetical protein